MSSAALRTKILCTLLSGVVLNVFSSTPAFSLDPSLDVSQYAHTSWKNSEGFWKGTIHAIAQGPDGYLWLATEFGLLRFDGVRAVLWHPPSGEHLPSSDIRSFVAASDGTLWLGTAKGLVSWKDGKLSHYPQFDRHDVHTLMQDREGMVWASGTIWEAGPSHTGNTILCAINSSHIQCYGEDGKFGGFGVGSIYEDSQGNLWLGASNGVWHWKPGPPKLYRLPELKRYGVGGLIFPRKAFAETDDGALLIAGPRGVGRFANGNLKPYPFSLSSPTLHQEDILRDRNGGLWMGTLDAGLLHVHQGRIDVFDQSDGLSTNTVENLFEDREGNIWVCTTNGLDRFRDYAIPTISVKQGLSSPFVRSVLGTKDGSVWLATPNGLNRWKEGQVTIYRSPGANGQTERNAKMNRPRPQAREVIASGLPDDDIGSLYEDPDGRVWISTAQGLAYYENGGFTPIPGVRLPSWSLSPVARDNSGNLWMTSDQGLYRLSRGKVAEYLPSERLGLRGLLSTLLVVDPVGGGLWVASWQGGVVYFNNGKVLESFAPANGLGAGRVNALQLDHGNALWAATDGGLSRIKDGNVSNLTSKNGLPCDTAHGVIEDDAHSLWVYMACGLVRITSTDLETWIADPNRQIPVKIFDSSDGVKSHAGVYNFGPRMTKAADGRLWFVPLDGVSVVDPRHLSSNTLPPPVHVEQIKANGKVYDPGAIRNRRLGLPSRVRDLSIEYTALSFAAPEKVRFRFKLEGQDKDWREVVNDREVQYSNLPPGTYRFRVIACNNNGVWNQDGDTLDFAIPAAFYQTVWFRGACIALVLLVVWSVYRARVHAVERRNRELAIQVAQRTAAEAEIRALSERLISAQEQERIRISQELHDHINQRIAALTLLIGSVRRKVPDAKSEAYRDLGAIRDELSELSTVVRAISHELHPAVLDYCDIAAVLRSHCKEFSALHGIEVALTSTGNFEDVPQEIALCVYRVTQEALQNVAKHASVKSAAVCISRSGETIELVVSDRGAGFEPDGVRNSGLGLVNIKERVRVVKGRVEIQSEPGNGTTVQIVVPIQVPVGETTMHS